MDWHVIPTPVLHLCTRHCATRGVWFKFSRVNVDIDAHVSDTHLATAVPSLIMKSSLLPQWYADPDPSKLHGKYVPPINLAGDGTPAENTRQQTASRAQVHANHVINRTMMTATFHVYVEKAESCDFKLSTLWPEWHCSPVASTPDLYLLRSLARLIASSRWEIYCRKTGGLCARGRKWWALLCSCL
jgi:hypothetical protein